MAYNKRELKISPPAIAPVKEKDVIVDPKGQWAHPGKVTKIPGNNITMKNVSYPVLGIDNLGNQKMIYPEIDYTFPGQTVTEYPMMNNGGWLNDYQEDIIDADHVFRKGGQKGLHRTTNKNIKSSINKLKLRNETLFGHAGKQIYDPNAKNWLEKYK